MIFITLRVNENILAVNFSGAGSLEESVFGNNVAVVFLDPERLGMTDDVVSDSFLLDRCHVIVELCSVTLAESPECIDLAVVINHDAGIETELCLNGIRKRTPGCLGSNEHNRRTSVLRSIHIECITLLNNVRRIKVASVRCRIADAVACPVGKVIYRC